MVGELVWGGRKKGGIKTRGGGCSFVAVVCPLHVHPIPAVVIPLTFHSYPLHPLVRLWRPDTTITPMGEKKNGQKRYKQFKTMFRVRVGSFMTYQGQWRQVSS